LQQAVQRFQELNDAERTVRTLLPIGANYVAQRQDAKAFAHFEQALALIERDSEAAAEVYMQIGDLQARVRQFGEAQAVYEQALNIWQSLGDQSNETDARRSLWEIFIETGRYAEAEEVANVGVGITSPISGSTVSNLVTVSGLAQHPQFRKAQVDLLIDGDASQATHLRVRGRPQWGNLLEFDSTKYPNGQHTLRLRVVHQDQNYDEYFTTIIISN
jgi:tetratricopeptide (TPR) repeat protein